MISKNESENCLSIPDAANSDAEGFELLRVWIAGGGLHVSLRPGVWEDPAAYGIALVDIAKHIANAHSELGGEGFDATLSRIREGMAAEWDEPTDEPTGNLQ